MKKIIYLIIGILFSILSKTILAQPVGIPAISMNWFRGGNNIGGLNGGNNIFGTFWSSSTGNPSDIYTFTAGANRTRLNGDFAGAGLNIQPIINGVSWPDINTSGYYGISPLGYFASTSPWSMLHLEGSQNPAGGLGWRYWMKTGAFIKENSDAMYVGLQQIPNTTGNRCDAIINWSDDATNIGGLGPDRLKIIFTGVANTGYGDNLIPIMGNSRYGYEFMEFTPFQNITNSQGYPVGHVGIGPTFTTAAPPYSRLHINSEDDLETWLQITNQTGTHQTATDGLRMGILSNGTVNFRQQENYPMIFYSDWGNPLGIITQGERLRITNIGNGIPNSGNLLPNTTRVSISEDGGMPIDKPRALLHLGYNTGTQSNGWSTTDGWRSWMNVGTFTCESTDHLYVGMKDESTLLGDRSDAVICWGDNHHQDSQYPYGQGPDNLRFIFTGYPTATNVDPKITSQDGLEVGRFTPEGRLGIGDFTPAGLNIQPTEALDVDGDGKFRQMQPATGYYDLVTIDPLGKLWRGNALLYGFGMPCIPTAPLWDLLHDWRVGINGYNIFFDGQTGNETSHIGIGYGCGADLWSKLQVLQTKSYLTIAGDRRSCAGGFISVPDQDCKYSFGVVGWAGYLGSHNVATTNIGVAGYANENNGSPNNTIGIYGISIVE